MCIKLNEINPFYGIEKDFNKDKKSLKLLSEIRYSISFLESYKNEHNDEGVKIYIPVKKKHNMNKKEFSRDSIYLCLKTIVSDGVMNGLSRNKIFDNVNKYIDLLKCEQLIDEEYYSQIKTFQNTVQKYTNLYIMKDIFLELIYEDKDTILFRKQEQNRTKIYYIGGKYGK